MDKQARFVRIRGTGEAEHPTIPDQILGRWTSRTIGRRYAIFLQDKQGRSWVSIQDQAPPKEEEQRTILMRSQNPIIL